MFTVQNETVDSTVLSRLARLFGWSLGFDRRKTEQKKVVYLNENRVSMLISMTEASKFSSIWMTEWLFDYIQSRKYVAKLVYGAFLYDEDFKMFSQRWHFGTAANDMVSVERVVSCQSKHFKNSLRKHKHTHRWTVKWKMLKRGSVTFMNWN